ncbi:DJ-1/PfpI family protein [Alcaligenes aquatilis]|uniref:Transcriptional regulator n=1 Tax=Alcaligenes aquatilis TaxID=323284 RepID=A0A3G2HTH8_9BURK|nr:DJ-1/PfpI family protein [Alcaligenes aquatilis]AYN20048.1 transcriptional regulator [Alcaligenes aquatilis]
MSIRRFLWVGLALLALSLTSAALWLFSLPMPVMAQAQAVPEAERQAMLTALQPPKRARPLVAVVGLNEATETTDYLLTAGVLRRVNVADVLLLATGPGPVHLYPALAVHADQTVAEFDARYPNGADYVIVPAMSRDDDPIVLAWLRAQADKGALIIGVCAGAKVVAAAGLLDGKRATTHWYYRQELLEKHPSITYVPNRRMVVDHQVATTTGITASMPMMLSLIEAIGGRRKSTDVARDLGMAPWDARHASDAFHFTRPFATTVLGNTLAFWRREQIAIELRPGLDEVSLALRADAWSRTYRSNVVTFSATGDAVESRHGFRIIPDERTATTHSNPVSALKHKPADALDQTLADIAARYGGRTADVVALQLEYPGFHSGLTP